jgi:hypothetical protein
MANRIFVSPGVFTSEKDLTFISQQVGVTTLGLVGETVKGPAFEPIFITDYEEYTAIFGGLNASKFGGESKRPKYELSYVAKSYLSESNQLFVSRVLGLTGYDAGASWLITADANYDPSTIASGPSLSFQADYSGSTIYYNFSGPGAAEAQKLYDLGFFGNGGLSSQIIPNDTSIYPEGIVFDETTEDTTFTGSSLTMGNLSAGTVTGTVVTYTATPYTDYEGVVLAMIRSRGDVSNDTLTFRTSALSMGVGNAGTDPEASFTLSATSTTTGNVTEYSVSLDTGSRNYITRVLGTDCFDKEEMIFVEEHYPNMLADMIDKGYIKGLNSTLVNVGRTYFNYQQSYQTPETPWIVSEVRGSVIDKLFKFVSISDGNSANKEIKISISNIKPDTKEFDVIVRDYNDTDSRPIILERFSKCVMDTTSDSYVARKIGTADGEFVLRSRYIMLVTNPEAPIDAFPAGFDGYIVRDYTSAVAPYIPYKTEYDILNEKIRKVYLGVSNVNGIDQNMFNWKGYTNDSSPNQWTATTKGFHMDSGATIVGDVFEVGSSEFRTSAGIEGTDYESISSRKFTLVPYLGFDGWNCYRKERTNTDRYKRGKTGFSNGLITEEFQNVGSTEGTSDYYAYLTGIKTFENPEAVNINILSTPGLDYEDHTDLVGETIDMIEEDRADSIYIVNSPEGVVYDTTNVTTAGIGFDVPDLTTVDDIVGRLEDADIDSNYTATYWPWIQMRDNENDVNIWLPPTVEVVRNLALTDNVSFPWFASAGYTRGLTNAIQARTKLTEEQRDVLYEGRINPMATFSDQGVIIWGNKNLQIRDSVLNRLNVRRLLLQTRKLISAVAVRLLFEQNDQIVRNQFNNLIQPILDNIRRERGIVDFRVVISDDPEEIDRNEMRGKIFIKPIPSLEFIDLEFVVTPTGASFDDI